MPDGGPFGPASVIVFGLLSAVAWGAGDFGGGLVARRVSVFALVFATQLVGMVVAVGLAVVRGEPVPSASDAGWAVLAGALGTIGILALYAGLGRGRMGVVAPVTGVLAATVPVLAGIVLEGLPDRIVLAGIAAAVLAVVLVSRVGSDREGPSGVELAIVAGVGIGLFNVVVSRISDDGLFGPLVIVRLAATVVVLGVLLATRRVPAVPRALLPAVVGIGVLDMAGNAGFLAATQTGALAIASVLSSLYPVTTVILAIAVLREPVTRSHAAGIALAALGIALIAAGSI